MTDRPLVSVGMPAYQDAGRAGAALRSLLAQDHPALEILVSDNASTDGTAEVLERVAAGDRRVTIARRDRTVPVYENFLGVLERASAEWFMWAATDDEWSSNYVSALLAALRERPDAVLATSSIAYVREDGSPLPWTGSSAAGREPIADMRTLLREKTQSWMYGLFRTAALRARVEEFLRLPVWGGDLVWLAGLCLDGPVVGAPEAVIVKRVGRRSLEPRGLGQLVFPARMGWHLSRISLIHGRTAGDKARAVAASWREVLAHWAPQAARRSVRGLLRRT